MFSFRLEPLITIRDNALKERQRELANANNVRRALEKDLQDIDTQLTDGMADVRIRIQAGQMINVNDLIGYRRQEMFLRFEQNKLIEQIENVDKEIEKCRTALIKANKELKIVEKLKEKQYERYQSEEEKAEAKFMDEIAGRIVR
jgi:flagellar FliJ protein